jgi:hypothetical protein
LDMWRTKCAHFPPVRQMSASMSLLYKNHTYEEEKVIDFSYEMSRCPRRADKFTIKIRLPDPEATRSRSV